MKTEQIKKALDLFSCAGGMGMGLYRAGFQVTAVDIVDRRNNPSHEFHQADALEYLADIISTGEIDRYELVHTSPPCQFNNTLTVGTNASKGWGAGDHVDLVGPTRELLEKSGRPYIIEQPNGRAKIRKDVTLCGEMFGLRVQRHRNFELGGWSTQNPAHVKHRGLVRGYNHGKFQEGYYVQGYGNGGGKPSIPELQDAMGIHWTDVREELTEALPPAYGEFLGNRFTEWMEQRDGVQ